ncbi:hypothetical protein FPV67DRAFT_1485413 [Lyophyllum atratum]|nr:hypothetical protein FPV67DRAFT_1485413 [Lyophyllum atratum]
MIVDDPQPAETTSAAPPISDPCNLNVVITDPPPPYPSRDRRRAGRPTRHAQRIQTSIHTQFPSGESFSDHEAQSSPLTGLAAGSFSDEHEEGETAEAVPFLTTNHARRLSGRPRTLSHTSTASTAPSLAQTVFSLFRTEDEDGFAEELDGGRQIYLPLSSDEENALRPDRHKGGFFCSASWRRYFRPLVKKAYWRSLFHLAVLNFPYALAAWVYLFIFTVAGTTLLMALPLGAILCFFNLLGARAFARGELALQTRFHSPLSYPTPYPPRPIFTRRREATSAEVEAGRAASGGFVPERSFYKNAYAMFADPTSYQSLFYFLVIKPSITLVFSLVLIVFVLPAMILVLPAPAALRAVRRLGIWQANVAIEGLYLAVR